MDSRKKAQDIFNETESVFSSKATFEEAYPDVATIRVEITELGIDVTTPNLIKHYAKSTLKQYINCSNDICYNGGFDIGEIIQNMTFNDEIEKEGFKICQGYEGSPKGMRRYRECLNGFNFKIVIEYKSDKK